MLTVIYSLLSAVFHPVRDLVLKNREPRYDLYLLAVAGWVPIAAIQILVTHVGWGMSGRVFEFTIISSFGNLLYYAGIAFALRYGDLSVYFPIFRTTPFFIALFNYIIWGTTYKLYFLLGICLIIIGVVIIHNGWRIIKKGSLSTANIKSLLFAILALLGSVVYVMADARAMQVANKPDPATYLFYNLLFCALLFLIFGLIYNKQRLSYVFSIATTFKNNWKACIAASATDYTSYLLILIAESMPESKVVLINSLRLWDIPLSVVFAGIFLKEKHTYSRLAATGIILIGSILVIYNK